jgi:dipeptidyl aminopeptidase/acylaminoacyl peptidase
MKKLLVALLAGAALTGISHGQGKTSPAPAAAANPADVVPLEAFSHWPDLQGPRISPGGKAIAAKIRLAASGRQALAIVPLGGAGTPEIIGKEGDFDKTGDLVLRGWRWADDDNLLITLTSRENFMGQTFDASRLIAYNRTTKKVTRLGWEGSKFSAGRVLWTSHEGSPTILLERTPDNDDTEKLGQPEVIKVDVLTGATQIVQRQSPSIDSWYADGQGVVRLGIGRNSSTGKVTVFYRPTADAQMRTIYEGTPARFSDIPIPAVFLKDGRALALSRKDDLRAVYELDLGNMTFGKKVFGVAGYDVEDISTGPEGDAFEAAEATEKREKVYYFEPRLKEVQAALEETFGKDNVYIASADRAREMIVALVAPPASPGTYYVYDTRSGAIGRLGYVNSALKDQALNPVSTIRYKARDGKEIEAVVTLPRHRAGQKNLPLIVLPHGGPFDARDSEDWEYVPWAQPLAELGYVVVQPNYRGSTGYGLAWEKMSAGNWGHSMQDDLDDAVAYLASQGIADPKRVCMMGWSYGGYAAARAAQRDGSKYRCAISGAGPTDLPAMVTYDKDYLGEYGAKMANGAAAPNLIEASPALHPEQFSAPILIIHGEHDQRVPVSQARNLVSKLRSAGKVEGRDFEYVEIPRETHNLLLESSRLKVLEAVKAFLDKHNPA